MVGDYASMHLSETDTRVHLIDPVLKILGYRGVDDIRREVPVAATREFIDYELRAGGRPVALVEAKAVKHAMTAQHAGQCVQYAAILGVRWCLITNGVAWTIFDAHAKGALADKHVAEVRLDGATDLAAKAWSVLSFFTLSQSVPLTKLLIDRVIADELSQTDAPAILALRRAVKDRFGENVSGQAVVDGIAEMVRAAIPGVGVTDNETLADTKPAPRLDHFQSPTPPRARVQKPVGNGLMELVASGLLPPDAELKCTLHGITHLARVRDGQIEFGGATYKTPSAAAAALKGGGRQGVNGWVTWKHEGTLLADLRAKLSVSSDQGR